MNQHQTTAVPSWFHSRYRGENRDDGCANELSVYRDPVEPRLDVLLTNVDFAGVGHENTYSLTRERPSSATSCRNGWITKNRDDEAEA